MSCEPKYRPPLPNFGALAPFEPSTYLLFYPERQKRQAGRIWDLALISRLMEAAAFSTVIWA